LIVSTPDTADIVGRAATVTTLGAASGGIALMVLVRARTGIWDLLATCNGILCGLVSITAGCSVFEPWAALITGPAGAFIFYFLEHTIQRLGIDDAVSASAMHGGVGTLGALSVGFLAKGDFVLQLLGKSEADFAGEEGTYKGLFYGGNGKLLGCCFIGAPLRCADFKVASTNV
jgi:ammonium transporter, Amt family